MRIVACIKQVPDTTQVKIDPVTNTLVREGIPFIVNPYDTHVIEESLALKDKFGFEVIVVSMGPPNAEMTLRKALAMGADRAILLSDRCFGGADTLATSNVLTAAIRKLDEEKPVSIVICGKQTIDGDTAQVGPGIATRLAIPQLTFVDKVVSCDPEKKLICVSRKLEGRHEIVESPMPAMITVVREINRPRYPDVPTRLASFDAPVEVWSNEVLKMNVETVGLKGSPTWVSKIFSPQRAKGEIIGDGLNAPEATVGELFSKMMEKDLLPL